MGSQSTFYDYIDENGVNVVSQWLRGPGRDARAKFNIRIAHLEATPLHEWREPFWKDLKGECDGLFEIRAQVRRVRFRLFVVLGPGQRTATIVNGTTKKG